MKRWDNQAHGRVEDPRVDAFLAEIVEVCRKHGMSLGHEDGHGSFVVHDQLDETIMTWISQASIERAQ